MQKELSPTVGKGRRKSSLKSCPLEQRQHGDLIHGAHKHPHSGEAIPKHTQGSTFLGMPSYDHTYAQKTQVKSETGVPLSILTLHLKAELHVLTIYKYGNLSLKISALPIGRLETVQVRLRDLRE